MIKKQILFGLGLIGCLSVFAQNNFGIIGGVQSTTALYRVKTKKQTTDNKTGAQLGATLKIPFDNQLYFSPMVYYSLRGFSVQLMDRATPPGDDAVSNDLTIHTVELAPLLQIDLSKKPTHLFVRFGPTINVGVSGKEEITLENGTIVNQDMRWGSAYYGRITSNAVAQLGFQSKGNFLIYGHYAHGLGSMNNNDDGPQIRQRLYGLSLGLYLKRKNPNVFDTRPLDGK